MTPEVAEILAGAFRHGCRDISEGLGAMANGLGAIAVALRPSMDADGCTHPEELRDHSDSTMGHIRWRCQCGHVYKKQAGG